MHAPCGYKKVNKRKACLVSWALHHIQFAEISAHQKLSPVVWVGKLRTFTKDIVGCAGVGKVPFFCR